MNKVTVFPTMSRRRSVAIGCAALLTAAWPKRAAATDPQTRFRVICDNDYAGDPDGLFQLAHHVLSGSVNIPLIVGSHIHPGSFWDSNPNQASSAAAKARELLAVIGNAKEHRVVAGAEQAIASRQAWNPSPATASIVREAMRTDTETRLFYAAGGGLTELALAWLAEPKIGKRITLVWIGGGEHPGLAYSPPDASAAEYNLSIDKLAAQIIFNESDIEIWQVPRDVYRQMLFSFAELNEVGQMGALGRYLQGAIDRLLAKAAQAPVEYRKPIGETYILGDNPLVTLTALQSSFEPDPSSSSYKLLPTPRLDDTGGYEARPDGRSMRVYTHIDSDFTLRDMVSKFRALAVRRP